jgi:putative ABC transport system permease protein
MKAVGAKNRDIMTIFMIESGLLGLAGGTVGTAMGVGVGKAVEVAAAGYGITLLKITFNPALIVGALLFSFFVGAVAGTTPALQAARLKPVNALRKK